MRKNTSANLIGNDRFEGFAIEIIDKLAILIGFNYTFELQEDNVYGDKQSDGTWSGMIGQIMNDQADLAIVDLTITSEREEAVDFSMPFME
jgi:ABC-type amino acid transport substrate-binding protein